ncbi:MAG TPA: hypothetical protein PKH10_06500 [bacterium]|nr:hypothetical protein [bacterium]
MCPLRTPTNIAVIVSFFALFIVLDIARRFVKDPLAAKVLRIVDTALYVAAFLFVASLLLRRFL